jgi:type IV secretion system protein VirB10
MTAPIKEDPAQLTLRARPRPVTRLNRRTLAVLAGILTVILLFALLWAFRAPRSGRLLPSQSVQTAEHVTRAEGLARLPRDYASIPKLGPPLGELGRPELNAENAAGVAALPDSSNFRPNPEEEAMRADQLRLQAEADNARKAQVFAQLRQQPDRAAGSPAASSESDTNTLDRRPAGSVDSDHGPNKQERKQAFADSRTDARIYASGRVETPRSPYQLMAGTIIAAALSTAINSDLPGQVIADVTENVYDTVTARFLLVPQGSRLLGQYDSQVAFGQRRVLLVWTRIVMPDGSSIMLDRLPGADTEGQAGLEDRVNWHWGRVFAGAAVSTLIGTAAELANPDRGVGQGNTVVVASRQSLQESVNQVGQEITRRNLDIQPTLQIRRGFRVRAIVNKDLILRPYEN